MHQNSCHGKKVFRRYQRASGGFRPVKRRQRRQRPCQFAKPKNCRMFLTLPGAAQSLIDCNCTGHLAVEVRKARELLNVLDASRFSPILDLLNLAGDMAMPSLERWHPKCSNKPWNAVFHSSPSAIRQWERCPVLDRDLIQSPGLDSPRITACYHRVSGQQYWARRPGI
jgi:hypothetical protein